MLMATENEPKRGPGRPLKAETERKRREINSRQRAYVLWRATPEATREPKTLKELCEVLGVSENAAWKWSKDPRIAEAIRFVALQNAGDPIKVKTIVDMLYDVAIAQQNPKVAEVWLKATGVFSQFGRTGDLLEIPDDAETDSFENYSLEELQRLKEEALAANLEQITIEVAQRKIAEAAESE